MRADGERETKFCNIFCLPEKDFVSEINGIVSTLDPLGSNTEKDLSDETFHKLHFGQML